MGRRPIRNRALIAAFVLSALMISAFPTPSPAKGPLFGSTYPSKVTSKFWRGTGNVLFCWVEIPLEINREIQNTDPFTGSLQGLFQGFYFTGRRLVLGAADMVTFPVDVYGNNFQSIQRSEFPFIDEVE